MKIIYENDKKIRLDKFLSSNSSLTRNKVAQYINLGQVKVNGIVVNKAANIIKYKDEIVINESKFQNRNFSLPTENELKMMDIRNSLFYNVVDPTKQAFENFMSSPEMKFTTDIFKLPYSVGKDMFEDKFINPYFKANGGPVFGTMQDAADFQRTEMLEQGKQEMQERTTPEMTTNILPDEIVEPFEDPPIGIGGRVTDDVFTAGYGMPIGMGGMAGQLTMPFESDPTLQLMLEQQLADDLSLNADVSLMEDRDPLLNLMLTKTF